MINTSIKENKGMRYATLIVVIALCIGNSYAEELRLTNSSQDTIVMKYLPTRERPKEMRPVEIPPTGNGRITTVEIDDQDPYDVTFSLKPTPDRAETVFHAKVGRPVPLRALARQGGPPIDVSLALAAKQVEGQIVYQITTATLTSGNRRIDVFSKNAESDLAKDVLERRWDTIYRARDGRGYGAVVDFKRLTFETRMFAGRFTDLAVFEEDQVCHIVGRWAALDSEGDVFFTVERDNPTTLKGEYTFDGEQDRFSWQSRP